MAGSDTRPQHTADGRHVVIAGRRWRATDPHVPEGFRAELVAELMAARRAVRAQDDGARARVHDAKVALGERGRPWWEEPDVEAMTERAQATARTLLRHRDPDASICPSDVARVIGGSGWRRSLDVVRAALDPLCAAGQLRATQGADEVSPSAARGPVRIRRGPCFEHAT